MKNTARTYISLKKAYLFFVLLFVVVESDAAMSHTITSHFNFKQLSIFNSLLTDEVQKVYQDKDGFMWFATRYGFFKYDGYKATLYKSNLYSPGLLTNNNIYCLGDDNEFNLWIGTQEGLNVLNKKTGDLILQTFLGKQLNILAPLRIAIIDITTLQTPVHIFICNHFQAIRISQPVIMGSNLRISIVDFSSIILLPCQSHIFLIERYKIFLTYFI